MSNKLGFFRKKAKREMTMIKTVAVVSVITLSLTGGCATRTELEKVPLRVKVKHVQTLPMIDGADNDAAWKVASALNFHVNGVWGKSLGQSAKVMIKSIYTDSHIAFLVQWEDATQDNTTHKPWLWNTEKNIYEQGKEQEDAMALAFEHTGPFTADMLSHVHAVWDLWTWKATRSDPVGYALDKTHRYFTHKPENKAKEYLSRTGMPIWIQRPDDEGESTQKPVQAPLEYSGDVLSAFSIKEPSGSAADIRAKGQWQNGFWTVELLRKLNTGHADDTAFDPAQIYAMAVSVQDRTGEMDKSSTVIQLSFEKK